MRKETLRALEHQSQNTQFTKRTTTAKRVSTLCECSSKSTRVLHDLIRIVLELLSHDFLELSRDTGNLMNVRSSLKTREHGVVDFRLQITIVQLEEDHTRTRSTKRFVCRGRDDVTVPVLEREARVKYFVIFDDTRK